MRFKHFLLSRAFGRMAGLSTRNVRIIQFLERIPDSAYCANKGKRFVYLRQPELEPSLLQLMEQNADKYPVNAIK